MGNDYRIRRDESVLADGSLFGRGRRGGTARWKIGLLVFLLALMGLVIWQADNIRPKVLSILGTGPTATPIALEYFKRGDFAFVRGDLDDAVDNYREAALQVPYNVDVLYELGRMQLYRSYRDARDIADIDEAIKWGSQAVETNPGNARAHVINCFALVRANKSEDAVRECKLALDQDPNNADAHAYLSMAYLDLNRLDEAFQEAQQAIKLDDKSIDASTAYAQVLATQKQLDAALDYYQRATQVNPRLEFPYFNEAYMAYSAYITQGDAAKYQIAIQAYNTILSISSQNVKAYTSLCWTYMAGGEQNLARDSCSTATILDPTYSPGWRWLGEVRYRTTDYEGAITAFAKCADLESSLPFDLRQPECWVLRGLAYYQSSHDCAQAMPIFTDVLSWSHGPVTIQRANKGIALCGGSS